MMTEFTLEEVMINPEILLMARVVFLTNFSCTLLFFVAGLDLYVLSTN